MKVGAPENRILGLNHGLDPDAPARRPQMPVLGSVVTAREKLTTKSREEPNKNRGSASLKKDGWSSTVKAAYPHVCHACSLGRMLSDQSPCYLEETALGDFGSLRPSLTL